MRLYRITSREIKSAIGAGGLDIKPTLNTKLMKHMFIRARKNNNIITSIKIWHTNGTTSPTINNLFIGRMNYLRNLKLSSFLSKGNTNIHDNSYSNEWTEQ